MGAGRGRAAELQTALEQVGEQLGDARVDKHEDARRRKKQEVVESFKREIPGVVIRTFLYAGPDKISLTWVCFPLYQMQNIFRDGLITVSK